MLSGQGQGRSHRWRRKNSARRPDVEKLSDDKQPGSEISTLPAEKTLLDDQRSMMQRLEAVLFLARHPLPSRRIAQLANMEDGTQARAMIRRLNERYQSTGQALMVRQVAGGYRLMTRPEAAFWLQRVVPREQYLNLSTPALETLAVVAYRQPIVKAEVEAIRGVGCAEMLRQLLDRGLVKIAGRRAELGNPLEYATTKKFLEMFGFPSLDALPRADKLRGRGMPPMGHAKVTAVDIIN